MSHRILAVASLALTLVAPGAIDRAEAAGDTAVAVLGVEASDGAPDSVATAVTDALRQRVSSAKGYRLIPGRDLMEVKLVFSCPDEAPSCMAQAAKSLGAAKLIFGTVKKAGPDGYLVTLKLLDATRGAVDAWVAEQITRAQATGPAIRGPAQKWLATLSGQGANGSIRVRADVVGASITLDNLPIGTTTTDSLLLSSIPAGKHQVVFTKAGYEPVRRDIDIRAGETEDLVVTLGATTPPPVTGSTPEPGPGGADTGADGSSRAMWRTAAWATLGASAVTLGLSIYFGVQVSSINSDLDQYRRFPCKDGDGNNALCNTKNEVAMALTPDERKFVDATKQDGKNFETYQWIAVGATGALMVASGFLLYKGYLAESANETAGNGSPRSFAARLRLVPQLGPQNAGMTAAFTF